MPDGSLADADWAEGRMSTDEQLTRSIRQIVREEMRLLVSGHEETG